MSMEVEDSPSVVNLFIEIGNSDNKLPQAEWSAFVNEVEQVCQDLSSRIIGVYLSESSMPYQNACYHIWLHGTQFNEFERRIGLIRGIYMQESIAVTQGDTVFVTGSKDDQLFG